MIRCKSFALVSCLFRGLAKRHRGLCPEGAAIEEGRAFGLFEKDRCSFWNMSCGDEPIRRIPSKPPPFSSLLMFHFKCFFFFSFFVLCSLQILFPLCSSMFLPSSDSTRAFPGALWNRSAASAAAAAGRRPSGGGARDGAGVAGVEARRRERRSKDATRNKCHASSNKCIATSNKCLTSSNKKLLGASATLVVTSASLLVTSALLVVTRSY